MIQPLGNFSKKLIILLPHDPVIMLLDIYPKQLEIYVQTKTYTWMFIRAFFIIAKSWKQPRCTPAGDGIHHTMDYYSALKRSELSTHEKLCSH